MNVGAFLGGWAIGVLTVAILLGFFGIVYFVATETIIPFLKDL